MNTNPVWVSTLSNLCERKLIKEKTANANKNKAGDNRISIDLVLNDEKPIGFLTNNVPSIMVYE